MLKEELILLFSRKDCSIEANSPILNCLEHWDCCSTKLAASVSVSDSEDDFYPFPQGKGNGATWVATGSTWPSVESSVSMLDWDLKLEFWFWQSWASPVPLSCASFLPPQTPSHFSVVRLPTEAPKLGQSWGPMNVLYGTFLTLRGTWWWWEWGGGKIQTRRRLDFAEAEPSLLDPPWSPDSCLQVRADLHHQYFWCSS